MHDHIVVFITRIVGTADTIVQFQRGTRLTVIHDIADLGAVAKQPIVARTVIRFVGDDVVDIVAKVHGTGHPVVQDERQAWLASDRWVAHFGTVAKHTVIARDRFVHARAGWGAGIRCADVVVIAFGCRLTLGDVVPTRHRREEATNNQDRTRQ